jgi:glucokinase
MSYAGVDIGGTKIAVGLVTEDGQVTDREECPTPSGGPAILQAAIDVTRTLIARSKDKVQGVGVGAGGQINAEDGSVYFATDVIPGWRGIQITAGFTAALQIPAKADNDVNVLGLGEARFGVGRPFAQKGSLIFLALGTGVGGAIVINGCVYHGANWGGGELGHLLLTMDRDARKDLGHDRGTLEAYCSGSGLVATWRELSGVTDGMVTGEEVVAMADKDAAGPASKAITKTGECLGFGLTTLANIFDPDLIVVGGGLSELGGRLLDPARAIMQGSPFTRQKKCQVVLPALGSNAAIVGAASLVIPRRAAVLA